MLRSRWLLALVPMLLATGCEYYDKPWKPLPEDFEITTLEGQTLRREDLLGKPWVVNIWVPG